MTQTNRSGVRYRALERVVENASVNISPPQQCPRFCSRNAVYGRRPRGLAILATHIHARAACWISSSGTVGSCEPRVGCHPGLRCRGTGSGFRAYPFDAASLQPPRMTAKRGHGVPQSRAVAVPRDVLIQRVWRSSFGNPPVIRDRGDRFQRHVILHLRNSCHRGRPALRCSPTGMLQDGTGGDLP